MLNTSLTNGFRSELKYGIISIKKGKPPVRYQTLKKKITSNKKYLLKIQKVQVGIGFCVSPLLVWDPHDATDVSFLRLLV